jgi:hypothetical protein
MKFNGFTLAAVPLIDAHCKECGSRLHEVSNGLLSIALYCPNRMCEAVYTLKMIRVPKKDIRPDYLEQCRRECVQEDNA